MTTVKLCVIQWHCCTVIEATQTILLLRLFELCVCENYIKLNRCIEGKTTASYWNIRNILRTYPRYLYMMNPAMHRQMSAYFLLCTFLILRTTMDGERDPFWQHKQQFTAASVCRWTHDAGLNSAPPRGSASARSHGNLTHLISSRVCLRYCLACKNYYTASFFFSSFFRALPEKTTNKMKTFNPEKVSSILKIVSSNLKYKNNEKCGKLYHISKVFIILSSFETCLDVWS